jgi:hypothetical protein
MIDYTHTRRLASFLKMDTMGPAELKKAIEREVPRSLAYHDWDGKVVNARELLQTEGLAATNLIPTETYATVIEGANAVKCFREALPVVQMPSQVYAHPYGATTSYAPIVAEGAEVPIETETLSVATLTAKKVGTRPLISNEMIADAKFDAIAGEIRYAGEQIENTINRDCLNSIIDGTAGSYSTDSGGSGATPIVFTGQALGTLIGRGHRGTDIIFHPTCYGAVLGAFAALNTNQANSVTSSGSIGGLFGLRPHICGIADSADTYVWGWGTDNYLGAVIIDKAKAGILGIREDIHVNKYPDTVRDMQGMTVLCRFDSASVLATAAQFIQY